MRAVTRVLGSAAGIVILAACTSGQSNVQPPHTAADVQGTSSLQFRVGTVNYEGTATYLDTVVTFRQRSGLSATLYDTPTITGPAGFTVPAAAPDSPATASGAGTDAGTNHISATPPTQPGTPAVATTFGQTGGAFAYGFAPANSDSSGTAFYAGLDTSGGGRAFGNALGATITDAYTQPVYLSAAGRRPFLLGPPVAPNIHDPNAGYPAGFLGYDSGFVSFAATPVAGAYALHVEVPGNTIGQLAAVFDVGANLTNLVPLGTEAPVLVVERGAGIVTFSVGPAAAGVTNRVIYAVGVSPSGTATCYSFSTSLIGGTFTLPVGSFARGDNVFGYAVGADWDIVAGAPFNNTSPAPALPAQTDITISAIGATSFITYR